MNFFISLSVEGQILLATMLSGVSINSVILPPTIDSSLSSSKHRSCFSNLSGKAISSLSIRAIKSYLAYSTAIRKAFPKPLFFGNLMICIDSSCSKPSMISDNSRPIGPSITITISDGEQVCPIVTLSMA